jgi:hypothetical protein
MDTITEDQDLLIPLTAHFQSKRTIQAIPFLATLGITAAMGTRQPFREQEPLCPLLHKTL